MTDKCDIQMAGPPPLPWPMPCRTSFRVVAILFLRHHALCERVFWTRTSTLLGRFLWTAVSLEIASEWMLAEVEFYRNTH